MKIETLDLTKKDKKEIIKFDESMNTDGFWFTTNNFFNKNNLYFKLKYRSDNYDFYLCQDEDGEHYLYRCKK